MKIITINQLRFAVLLIVLTIIFRYGLSAFLSHHQFTALWIWAVGYGIAVFVIGWIFGKKDCMFLKLYDIGFRFHITTFIVCNTIAELWFLFGFNSALEKVKTIHLTTLYWGIFLFIHFLFFLITRKNAISGIKKAEIFE